MLTGKRLKIPLTLKIKYLKISDRNKLLFHCFSGCSDKKKSCTWWKQQGYCDKRSKYNPYMMKNCKVSCGNCGGKCPEIYYRVWYCTTFNIRKIGPRRSKL